MQFIFGMAVLASGVFMIMRGFAKKDNTISIEDKRAEWLAYDQLKNIEENTFKMVEQQRLLTDAINRLTSVLYNRAGFGP